MPEQPVVYVPIPASIYSEFILRRGEHYDVAARIEGILADFLDRTRGDADIWSEQHAEEAAEDDTNQQEQRRINGDPSKGYQWQTVFLPNGTQVRMLYRAQNHYAAVQHERLIYEGESLSPSEFASRIAVGTKGERTNRNAWRDLYLLLPGRKDWVQADVVRKQRVGGR
jgi:hypothetical protein